MDFVGVLTCGQTLYTNGQFDQKHLLQLNFNFSPASTALLTSFFCQHGLDFFKEEVFKGKNLNLFWQKVLKIFVKFKFKSGHKAVCINRSPIPRRTNMKNIFMQRNP